MGSPPSPMPRRSPTFVKQAEAQKSVDFVLNIIPDSVVGALARGDILQVLLFAILFGFALMALGERGRPAARHHRRRRACGVRRHRHRHEGRAVRRVRRDGLHHRQVRARSARQSDRTDRAVLCDRGAVRGRRARPDRARRRLQHLQVPRLHQGRTPDRARHQFVGKRAAAIDGEAGAARLLQVGGRPGGADRLFVQSRRHQHLHDAGDAVHRAGAGRRSHVRPAD